MRKVTFDIRTNRSDIDTTTSGYLVAPGLVAHRAISKAGAGRLWALSHHGTGLALRQDFHSRQEAADAAERVAFLVDWESMTESEFRGLSRMTKDAIAEGVGRIVRPRYNRATRARPVKPEQGRTYRLTGTDDVPSVARGDGWEASEVKPEPARRKYSRSMQLKLSEYPKVADAVRPYSRRKSATVQLVPEGVGVDCSGTYWDGGSRSQYYFGVGIGRESRFDGIACPTAPPQFGGGEAPHVALDAGGKQESVLRTGTFRGKPAFPTLYIPAADAAAWGIDTEAE